MEALNRFLPAALLAIACWPATAASAADGTIVYGEDWGFAVSVPDGWEFDCCTRAREFHANLLLFPHGWDGSAPDRVMVLSVWGRERSSIDADFDADAKAYQSRFQWVKPKRFPVTVKDAACRSVVYAGGDDVRDYVVFCDPGEKSGSRFAWSMSLQGTKSDRTAAEAAFRYVVTNTLAMPAEQERKQH